MPKSFNPFRDGIEVDLVDYALMVYIAFLAIVATFPIPFAKLIMPR